MTHSIPHLDHEKDANPVVFNWAIQNNLLPESCQTETPEGLKKEASEFVASAFADQEYRSLPLYSPDQTLKSAAYAFGLPESSYKAAVLKTLKSAAENYGILEKFNVVQAGFEQPTLKSATAASDPLVEKFALAIDQEDGSRQYLYPIENARDIKQSCDQLQEDAEQGRLPASWVSDSCQQIKKAAKRLQEPVTSFVEKEAADKEFCPDTAVFMLGSRERFAGEHFETYKDVIKSAHAGEVTPQEAEEYIGYLDAALEIPFKDVPSPRRVVFSGLSAGESEKFAMTHVPILEAFIPIQEIACVKESNVRLHWPKAQADQIVELCKAAAADTSLPACDAADSLSDVLKREFLKFLVDGRAQ